MRKRKEKNVLRWDLGSSKRGKDGEKKDYIKEAQSKGFNSRYVLSLSILDLETQEINLLSFAFSTFETIN